MHVVFLAGCEGKGKGQGQEGEGDSKEGKGCPSKGACEEEGQERDASQEGEARCQEGRQRCQEESQRRLQKGSILAPTSAPCGVLKAEVLVDKPLDDNWS